MISGQPLHDLSIFEASQLIRDRQISPIELTKSLLKRIDEVEDQVHAWVTVMYEEALRSAQAAEEDISRGMVRGPLHGIPYGAKDIYYTAGIRTTGGSKVEPDFIPSSDATVITKLHTAGAVLLGKTTTTEYAFLGGAPHTRNPWNLNHTPGGSSAGSAAAVAASMALFTLGTQTAGSLSRPAAYNGLTTLKPTYGRISRVGIMALSWSLDHAGAITRTVKDTAIVLSTMAGKDPADPTTLSAPVPDYTLALGQDIKGMVLGVPETFFFDGIDPELMKAMRAALQVFQDLGACIIPVKLPFSFEDANVAHWIVMRTEAAAYHQDFYKKYADRYGPSIREALELGQLTPAVDYLRAQRIRNIYREELLDLLQQVDALITPTAPGPAPEGIAATGTPVFNVPFTCAGVPTLSIPIGFTYDLGLPLGLQLVSRPLSEELLITLGDAYQTVTNWHQMRPQIKDG
ncbi:amidase [Effusibacillus dendaii]|uniref:Amidase n=1 Tax=Effusibacillus dendaii TaxID=2743772 RepID=A0A7I8D9Z6_9BACL|nr:amidase [Effusibacillus dendaii]BCJ85789.1 amidase [Effusibacillus dendaii]